MRNAALALLVITTALTAPARADRPVDMGNPVLSATFVGQHAADCAAGTAERTDVEVNGCFDRHIDPVMKAWQRALQRNMTAGGHISLRLRIDAQGRVRSARVASADPGLDRPFRDELLAIARGIDFLPAARAATITHQFSLSPK